MTRRAEPDPPDLALRGSPRRALEVISRPLLSLLDVAVLGVLWWVLNSSYHDGVKALILLAALVVGGSSFTYGRWWRVAPQCEVRNCTLRAGPQLAATADELDVQRYRRLCGEHWKMWAADDPWARDALMVVWGWPGEAWWRPES